jgi:hypothetical protein
MARQFRPTMIFTLRQNADNTVTFLEGAAPAPQDGVVILGEYHPGTEYWITPTNKAAVAEAVTKNFARMV